MTLDLEVNEVEVKVLTSLASVTEITAPSISDSARTNCLNTETAYTIPFKKPIELTKKGIFKQCEPFRVGSSIRGTSGNLDPFLAITDTRG